MLHLAFGFSSVSLFSSKRYFPSCHCGVQKVTMSGSNPNLASSALTLVSAPVSGYAMRVRYIVAKKGLGPDVIQTRPPADFGGLKSEQYLAVNPLGKMPALFIRDPPVGSPGVLFESRVIADYLIDRFSDVGPSFIANTPERRAVGNLVATICDNYIAALQPYMYKPYDSGVDRAAKIREMSSAFDAIETILDSTGPYVAGSEVSVGDAALLGK
jgi:glutathione S-transferase